MNVCKNPKCWCKQREFLEDAFRPIDKTSYAERHREGYAGLFEIDMAKIFANYLAYGQLDDPFEKPKDDK